MVAALLEGPKRFNELQEELDGIAPNVLSARLKALDRAGARASRSPTPSARRGSRTSSRSPAASWPARCGCWPTGARAPAGGEPLRHDACGGALEARWWCPACGIVVDDPDDEDLVHVVATTG